MTRPAIALVAVVLINISNTVAFAGCGAGGYRPAVRYHAPQIYRAPIHRQVIVHQPAPTIRTITVAAPRPAIGAAPQSSPIRLAPTQLNRRTQPAQTQQSQPQPTQTQQPPTQPSENLSALALLMGNSDGNAAQVSNQPSNQPETRTIATSTTQTTASTPNHIGTWRATTSGNATVTLTLNADNSFSWMADNAGKTNRFDGTFSLSSGKLTLARASDNQKLAGDLTFSSTGFNFKLAGAKDAGLNFAR